MDKGTVHIYCGKGKGKTTAAIGQAIKAACEGRNVVFIEFLKAKEEDELGFLKRLEPEIKVFRFEKFQESFDELPDNAKEYVNFIEEYTGTKVKLIGTGADRENMIVR